MSNTQQPRYAFILRANGEFEVTDWPTGGTLEFLRTAIDCHYVEAVTLSPHFTLWLDEEGRNAEKQINYQASIFHAIYKEPNGFHHGTVVITGGPINGETQGLDCTEIATLAEFLLTFTGARIPTQRTK